MKSDHAVALWMATAADVGYVIVRGGRNMDNHFECMWDLFRSIPSIEDENHSIWI